MAVRWMASLLAAAAGATAESITDEFVHIKSYCDGSDDAMCGTELQNEGFTFPHTDPHAEYNKVGIKHAQEGDLTKAREYFRAATLHSSFRGDSWSNVGLSLKDQCQPKLEKHGDKAKKACLSVMRESLACFDIGEMRYNDKAAPMRREAQAVFDRHYAGECEATDCDRYKNEKEAMRLVKAERLEDGVNLLCDHPDKISIALLPWERKKGILSCETMRRITILLRVCGVVALQDVLDPEVVEAVGEEQQELFDDLVKRLGGQETAEEVGSDLELTDAASRGSRRFEQKFPLRQPFMDPRLVANRFVLTVVKSQLGDKIELDTFSAVTSLPGGVNQAWHADVPDVFSREQEGEGKHPPPQGLIAVVPFVDLTDETGPTEYYMGSHVNVGDYFIDNENDPPTPQLPIEAITGDAIIFDMRIRHRGRKNQSPNNRAIGYLGYVRDWYIDKVNFKEKQTRAFDQITLKKLFARLDSRQYAANLEALVAKHNIADLADLESDGSYGRKVHLKA